jgi:hypothetical protein
MVPGFVFWEALGLKFGKDTGVLSVVRGDHLFKGLDRFLLFDLFGDLLGVGESCGAP